MTSTIDFPFLDDNTTSNEPCGLFSTAEDETKLPIPLKSRQVKADVFAEHCFTEITETHSYVADEDSTCTFIFPLPPRSAIFRFKATIGDREVITEVKRKVEAQAEFDSAVRQGHTAVHLQQGKGSQLYKVSIGNLISMEECIIEFSYVRILNSVAGSVEFEHSATWVPPYQRGPTLPHPLPYPHPRSIGDSPAVPAQDPLAQAATVLPSSEGNPTFSLAPVSYKLSYQIRVRSSRGFTSVECPTASTPIKVIEEGDLRIVNLDEAVSDPSKDFTLLIEVPPLAADSASCGNLLVQECTRNGKKKQVALATFIPPTPPPPSSAKAATQHTEIIFIIDGSGSMHGSPIAQALEASLYFVKDLPVNAHISLNVAVFGSSSSLMWPQSKGYNEESQLEAVKWIQDNVNANYGGTEVLSVLQAVYSQPLAADTARQIIFLTDGGVDGGEESRIFDLIEGKGETARKTSIFSLGIGHGVHRGLVEGVAKRSGGIAQFVVDGEPLAKKIGLLKKCALAAANGCYSNPKLLSRSALIRSAPNVLPPRLFSNEPFSVLAEIMKSEPSASLDLSYDFRVGKIASACQAQSLTLDKAVHLPDGHALSVLHAMACIGSLLNGTSELHLSADGTPLPSQPQQQDVEDAVVLLAISEGLVTPHTSAVGVMLQRDPLDPSKVKKFEVPLQVPAGRKLWEHEASNDQAMMMRFRGAPPMMACAAPMMMACAAPPPMPRMMMKCAAPMPVRSLAACSPSSYAAQNVDLMALDEGLIGRGELAVQGHMLEAMEDSESLEMDASNFKKKSSKRLGSAIGGIFGSIASAFGGFGGGGGIPAGALARCSYVPSPASYTPTSPASNFMAAEKSVLKESAPPPAPALSALSTSQVLSMLNLKRSINGSIPHEPSVMEALAGEGWRASGSNLTLTLSEYAKVKLVDAIHPSLAASDIGAEIWTTVLSLAWLKKHAASDKAVWAGLETKAVAWLGTVWKDAGANGSVGACILNAMKLI